MVILNTPVTYLTYGLVVAVLAALLLNIMGFPWAPGFTLYYAALLGGLTVVFLVFADVVVTGDDEIT